LAQLSTMTVPALIKLRHQVDEALKVKANDIRKQLSALDSRSGIRGKSGRSAAGKVAPKYQNKSGNTWSGRGLPPKWMTAAIKAGAKRDDFLINKK
jgi:DNA-binding protein H-NS